MANSTPLMATTPLRSISSFSTTSTPRLQSLYSDFSRQKQSNPTSYNANVEWWRKALEGIVSSGLQQGHQQQTTLMLCASQSLLDTLKIPKVGKPLALGTVISELCDSRTLVPLSDFLSPTRTSIYDPGWLPRRIAAYIVGKPLWWALERLGVVGEEGLLGSGNRTHISDTRWQRTYVFVPLVERAADSILERHRERMVSPGDALYTRKEFSTLFYPVEGGSWDEDDTKVLIQHLHMDRRAIVVDGDFIKFVDADASPDMRTVTAVDRGILELKAAVNNLHKQVESIQKRIEECTSKASAAIQAKRKTVAVSYLRSRKQLEGLLQERLGSLNTLESTFIAVEAAAGNVEIMKMYQSSTTTLKTILADPLLQRANIDATLEALAEANADASEIDSAISIGANVATGANEIDDTEIEDELKAMIQEAEEASRKDAVEAGNRAVEAKLESAATVPIIESEEKNDHIESRKVVESVTVS